MQTRPPLVPVEPLLLLLEAVLLLEAAPLEALVPVAVELDAPVELALVAVALVEPVEPALVTEALVEPVEPALLAVALVEPVEPALLAVDLELVAAEVVLLDPVVADVDAPRVDPELLVDPPAGPVLQPRLLAITAPTTTQPMRTMCCPRRDRRCRPYAGGCRVQPIIVAMEARGHCAPGKGYAQFRPLQRLAARWRAPAEQVHWVPACRQSPPPP